MHCKCPKTSQISKRIYGNTCCSVCGNVTLRPIHVCRLLQCVVTCSVLLKLRLLKDMATSQTWQDGLSMFAEFEKLPCNSNFSQISQAFPLASLNSLNKQGII